MNGFGKETAVSKKFIPNGDIDFDAMAQVFSNVLWRDPVRFGVSPESSDALAAAVWAFHDALAAARAGGARSQVATRIKDDARAAAEKIIRRIAGQIRADETVTVAMRLELGMRERAGKPKVLGVPNESPRLRFVRAIHEAAHLVEHELSFTSLDDKPRPPGAVRVELFIDLVPPEAPIPSHPAAGGARPFYVRSYARSPIRLMPPRAKVPMRVVYWARWADSVGNVGPMSATAAGWVEGGSLHINKLEMSRDHRPLALPMPDNESASEGNATVFVALLEMQAYAQPLADASAPPRLVEGEVKRLEGSTSSAAA